MDPKSIVTFVNITDKPFTGYWDKEAFPFNPSERRSMELWRALHFAKHLVDQILNERNIPTNTQTERDKLVAEIIKGVQPATVENVPVAHIAEVSTTATSTEVLVENQDESEDSSDDVNEVAGSGSDTVEAAQPAPTRRGRGRRAAAEPEFEGVDNE